MTNPDMPRLLTIMGSGETAPTMVKVHRAVLERLGPPPVPAVLLDTPYAFQENAPELCQKIQNYFAESLRTSIDIASAGIGGGLPSAPGTADDPFADERIVSAVRAARYVFAGPGSPTYALRRWTATIVPSLMREKLRHGGAVTFSSAAALTLGISTVPVYEIYKVGQDPYWLEGLDIFSETGLSAAVIPHYNNAEGGTHDTRFCYLGERRLAGLEPVLPEGAFVLGVDEHTAVTFDLDTRTATIAGLGVVTVRVSGRSRTFSSGETVAVDEIRAIVEEMRNGTSAGPSERSDSADVEAEVAAAVVQAASPAVADYQDSPLITEVREQEETFAKAVESRDTRAAVAALLDLDRLITQWATDIPAGDAMDRARASFRSLVVELGKLAETGARDPRETLGPFVEALLVLRTRARLGKRYDESDFIRDRLTGLGVEVRDTADGSEWVLG